MASVAAPSPRLTRSHFFLGLFLVAALNSVAGTMLASIEQDGWLLAISNLFGISAIIWTAIAAAVSLLARADSRAGPSRPDLAIGAAVCVAALFPHSAASKLALSLLALHLIVTTRSGLPQRRGAFIILALSGALLWGRVVLTMFSRPLLDIEAGLVGALLGARHEGNILWHDNDAIRLVVSPGCSAMAGLSIALLFWVTINAYYEVRIGWRAVATCVLALLATLLVNVLRMASMLRYPEQFEALHTGWGAQVAMWTSLILIVGICLFGARREILAPR